MTCSDVLKLDPEVMTKSETEPLGEVSGIVMPEGSNLNTPHANRDENLLYHMLKCLQNSKNLVFQRHFRDSCKEAVLCFHDVTNSCQGR